MTNVPAISSRMIRCLLADNDTVVDKFLSESVLELEYLEKKVSHHDFICSLTWHFALSTLNSRF